jgi:hypothetical protein
MDHVSHDHAHEDGQEERGYGRFGEVELELKNEPSRSAKDRETSITTTARAVPGRMDAM